MQRARPIGHAKWLLRSIARDLGPRRPRSVPVVGAEIESLGPRQATTDNDRAWQRYYLHLNGLSMSDMLAGLSALPPEQLRGVWTQRDLAMGLVNVPRIEYAYETVANRALPSVAPGDLEVTGQVRDAAAFLARKSGAAASTTPARPARTGLPPPTEEQVRDIAFQFTGIFEGGKPDSLQLQDIGVISYGKHQATLASGALGHILTRYRELSSSPTATSLEPFMARVSRLDATLRHDAAFLRLLKEAAREPAMAHAQDQIFTQDYWRPAVAATATDKLKSPLAKLMYYDTSIQGGLGTIRTRTRGHFAGKTYTESEYLTEYNAQRSRYLSEVAANDRTKADAHEAAGRLEKAKQLRATAVALDISSRSRVGAWQSLVASGDLDLRGDAYEQIRLAGRSISGIGSVAQSIALDLDHAETTNTDVARAGALRGAFQRLNALAMPHLLLTLADLRRRDLLDDLVEGFAQAAESSVLVPRLEAALQAIYLKGRLSREEFDESVLGERWPDVQRDGNIRDQRAALLAYVAKPSAKGAKPRARDLRAIVIALSALPSHGTVADVPEALRLLNALEMSRMLAILTALKSGGLFALLDKGFDRAAASAGVFAGRLKVALEAVKARGTKAAVWDTFKHAVIATNWPSLETDAPDQAAVLRKFLEKK